MHDLESAIADATGQPIHTSATATKATVASATVTSATGTSATRTKRVAGKAHAELTTAPVGDIEAPVTFPAGPQQHTGLTHEENTPQTCLLYLGMAWCP